METFGHLAGVHSLLRDIFVDHRKALLGREIAKCRELLEYYEAVLLTHMAEEEEILIPLYEKVYANGRGAGRPEILLADHMKMRSFITAFKQKIEALAHEADQDRELLRILDREAFYIRLCNHHDKREEDFLYPTLDCKLTRKEKESVIAKLSFAFGK